MKTAKQVSITLARQVIGLLKGHRLPDLGEQLALRILNQLCRSIKDIYPVGAEIIICSENLDQGIDELSRLDPAVTFIFRVTKRDTTLGNQKIKAGDVIFISTHSVNRDPQVFSQPNQCLLTRKNTMHLSYGFGAYFCIGAKLARLEMQHFGLSESRQPKLGVCTVYNLVQ